jgi:hypothetical protein
VLFQDSPGVDKIVIDPAAPSLHQADNDGDSSDV